VISNPTPQRQLRGHMPQRPTPRAATTGEHHAQLAGRLTARDRWLARMLHEHRVLTTQQIVDLAFPAVRSANHRLLELYKWRVVDRFQPFVHTGTAPMHYVLDIAGAVALAYEDGLEPKDLRYRHDAAIGIAHSLRLAHSVGTNGFFTNLVALSRRPGAPHRLTTWWSETRCGRHFGDMVRPDAYGRWREMGKEIEFFLEFDFGTEDLATLARKLRGYEKLAAATAITTPVLFWLPSNRREASARRALTEARAQLDRPTLVPAATSAAGLGTVAGENTPASARWLPIQGKDSHSSRRLRLAALSDVWPTTTASSSTTTSVGVSTGTNTTPAPAELTPPTPMPPEQPTYRIRK
jgi:hypothetical protein